ncbi:hypothetical protein EJ04DRAFT_513488 [Polyplosphaeria fusca]|uniref:Oxidase ustYa n=1 Tax=Polyplosphaeria fusca TaxID=682080 RepID=A0A9P4V288_9PLEO|nr:hypothetical protein EJ04DRAFT_513488 [Polyplosphaeria fusca]
MKDDKRYTQVRTIDDESEPGTEVEDWNAGEAPSRSRRRGFWAKAKRYRWIVDTALLLVILGLLVEKRWTKHRSHRYEVTGDITGFAPQFSQQIVSFKPDFRFAPENASDFFLPETKSAWLSIVPRGLGYVGVKDPSKYDELPKPIHDYTKKTVFTTSMTHQLHCLYTILEAYNKMSLPTTEAIDMPWHINHCFEYIRQGIMCAGDVALEGAATTFPSGPNGEDLGGSDGWDSKHVCKNYDEIYAYLERETVNHSKWISSD